MRPKHRQCLSCVLLAIYASISILGDGLHSLLPAGEHQHHHQGLYVVSHGSGGANHAGHDHDAVTILFYIRILGRLPDDRPLEV